MKYSAGKRFNREKCEKSFIVSFETIFKNLQIKFRKFKRNGKDAIVLTSSDGYLPSKNIWRFIKKNMDSIYKKVKQKDIERAGDKLNRRTTRENQERGDELINLFATHKRTIDYEMIDQKQSEDDGHLYLLESGGYYKIGITKNMEMRLKSIRTSSPYPVKVICKIRTNCYKKKEKELHKKFQNKNVHGEWFNLDKNDIKYIKKLDKEK